MHAPPPRLLAAALGVVALAATVVPAAAQGVWREPESTCDVGQGHHLVTGAVLHLKQAVEGHAGSRESRLTKAFEVLQEAIVEKNQAGNPAAWYYLGRAYVLAQDPAGADSAFGRTLALAPQCEEDVSGYRALVQPVALGAAVEAWQASQYDSAAALFRLSHDLTPHDANVPYLMGMMYAVAKHLDSAEKYVVLGNQLAGDDERYDARRRQAMLELARGWEARAYEHEAVLRAPLLRVQRDSLRASVAQDSTTLADLIAEWSGKRLRPDVREAVQRDSVMLEHRLASARAAIEQVAPDARRDSVTAGAHVSPAIAAYEAHAAAYPDDPEPWLRLVRLHGLVGDGEALAAAVEQLRARADADPDEMVRTAMALQSNGEARGSADLAAAALERRPHHRDALMVAARATYSLRDAERFERFVERLADIEPLSPNSMRLLAAVWDLRGARDSTAKYMALADSGLGWSVTITQFVPTGGAATINGAVANIARRPLPPAVLEFEFLTAAGDVVAGASVELPALEPGARHPIAARAEAPDAVAWRYHRR